MGEQDLEDFMKTTCEFCSKFVDGKCRAKKNAAVEKSKPRKCSKYEEDAVRKVAEENRKKTFPPVKVFQHTYRYYDQIWAEYNRRVGKKVEDGPVEKPEEEVGPLLVRVK